MSKATSGIEEIKMLNLPKTTEFNKRIPKQKFYENMQLTTMLKKSFVEQIRSIHWTNKIAPCTINLAAGENVEELEVFTIRLNSYTLDEAVLRQIDREIPYHILYLLEYEDQVQAWIGYKEASASGATAFKVSKYYHTEWISPDDLALKLEGLTTDAVYENFVRQIAGAALADEGTADLKEAISSSERKNKMKREIAKLEKLAWAEKQPKRKMEYLQKIKLLKANLEDIG